MDASIALPPTKLLRELPWAPSIPAAMSVQRLPFVVRPARDERDLASIVVLRRETYGRHAPEVARSLVGIEPLDRCPGSLVLLAECREGRRILGTMRLQHNSRRPLLIEDSLELPPHLRDQHLVEATRLSISQGAPPEVRWALFKAGYLHCVDTGAQWMLACARRSLARIYEGLRFKDLLEVGATYPMRHVGHLPHRAMALPIDAAEKLWQSHPMRAFMVDTHHPDVRW